MQSMLGGLENVLVGDPILSSTINLRTVESETKSLSKVQYNNKDVDIGSYPFLRRNLVFQLY